MWSAVVWGLYRSQLILVAGVQDFVQQMYFAQNRVAWVFLQQCLKLPSHELIATCSGSQIQVNYNIFQSLWMQNVWEKWHTSRTSEKGESMVNSFLNLELWDFRYVNEIETIRIWHIWFCELRWPVSPDGQKCCHSQGLAMPVRKSRLGRFPKVCDLAAGVKSWPITVVYHMC